MLCDADLADQRDGSLRGCRAAPAKVGGATTGHGTTHIWTNQNYGHTPRAEPLRRQHAAAARDARAPARAEIESNSARSSRALERIWKECEATAPRGTTVSTARRTRRGLDSRQLTDPCRSPGRRPALLGSCGPAARLGPTGVEGDAVSRGDAMLEEVVEKLLQLLGRHRSVAHAARTRLRTGRAIGRRRRRRHRGR